MSSATRLMLVAVLLGLASTAHGEISNGLKSVFGTWQIAAVDIDGEGVQAFGPDDPTLVGAKLIMSSDKIYWDSSNTYFRTKTCLHPILRAHDDDPDEGGESEIFCDQGIRFGPKHVLKINSSSEIIVHWFDSVTARTIRVR